VQCCNRLYSKLWYNGKNEGKFVIEGSTRTLKCTNLVIPVGVNDFSKKALNWKRILEK
jgi:hypothetical protein